MFSKSFLHKICEYRIKILSLKHQTIINDIIMSNDKKTIKGMRANEMTWFRGMERRGFTIHWIDALQPMEQKVEQVLELMKSNQ